MKTDLLEVWFPADYAEIHRIDIKNDIRTVTMFCLFLVCQETFYLFIA